MERMVQTVAVHVDNVVMMQTVILSVACVRLDVIQGGRDLDVSKVSQSERKHASCFCLKFNRSCCLNK